MGSLTKTDIPGIFNATTALTAAYTVVAADRGKLFDCTGTFTVTLTAAATLGAGFSFAVRNSGTGVITLDPNLAELVDGVATITVQAGDSCLVACDGAAFKTVGRRPPGRMVQNLNLTTGAMATGTTIIPHDDTIPQITEGDQYMSLAITPTNALSILEVTVVYSLASSIANVNIGALFRDAVAGAIGSATQANGGNFVNNLSFTRRVSAGSVAETTFKFRAGGRDANTTTFNGEAGAAKLGGTYSSSITIKEYLP